MFNLWHQRSKEYKKITRVWDREQQNQCEPRTGAACHMWDQGNVFDWLVACRVECTVSPGARSNPSCFPAESLGSFNYMQVMQNTFGYRWLQIHNINSIGLISCSSGETRLVSQEHSSYIKHYTATNVVVSHKLYKYVLPQKDYFPETWLKLTFIVSYVNLKVWLNAQTEDSFCNYFTTKRRKNDKFQVPVLILLV